MALIKSKYNENPVKLADKFDFGQYKGDSLEQIVDTDIAYIGWCLEKEIFKLDFDAKTYYTRKAIQGEVEYREMKKKYNKRRY